MCPHNLKKRAGIATQVDVLTHYLHSVSEETISIAACKTCVLSCLKIINEYYWPELKDIFIKLNKMMYMKGEVPSSTSAERLFSCAGLVMSSKELE